MHRIVCTIYTSVLLVVTSSDLWMLVCTTALYPFIQFHQPINHKVHTLERVGDCTISYDWSLLETCWCILQYVHIIKGEKLLEQIYLEICVCVCSKIRKMLPIHSEICCVFCTRYSRACTSASGGTRLWLIPIASNHACLDNKSSLCHSSVFLLSPSLVKIPVIYIIIHLLRSLLSQPPSANRGITKRRKECIHRLSEIRFKRI